MTKKDINTELVEMLWNLADTIKCIARDVEDGRLEHDSGELTLSVEIAPIEIDGRLRGTDQAPCEIILKSDLKLIKKQA